MTVLQSRFRMYRFCLAFFLAGPCSVIIAEEINLNALPTDLTVPAVEMGQPAAGKRVQAVTAGWEGTAVRHTVFLPPDWRPDQSWPVLVEFPGNGGYRNAWGDFSDGTVEGCVLGYGLSGGQHFLWVCLPCIQKSAAGNLSNCPQWWGDVSETKRYCVASVRELCQRYGGDPRRVVLCGFSRGSIACNFIGLHDEEIAGLWRGFFCHSHYDGVRSWPYPGSDQPAARERLKRLNGRPQWISHEQSIEATQTYLEESNVNAPLEFVPIPYPNHSATWVLRDLPERRLAREWLQHVISEEPSGSEVK